VLRKLLGRLIEWALGYEHEIEYVGSSWPGGFKGLRGVREAPHRKYDDDAGYDLYASETVTIMPGKITEVPSGIRISPKDQLWMEIKSRSSTFVKRNLYVQDAVIDRGFRGDLFCIVHNPTSESVTIVQGERICQVIPHRLIPCTFVKRDELPKSGRDTNGFGSTGN
jgi:dUTP pyrophosphatase